MGTARIAMNMNSIESCAQTLLKRRLNRCLSTLKYFKTRLRKKPSSLGATTPDVTMWLELWTCIQTREKPKFTSSVIARQQIVTYL